MPNTASTGDAAGTSLIGVNDFVVSGAAVFDGERSLGVVDVAVRDGFVVAVGGDLPPGFDRAERVDGSGGTLLPGLIDSHVHTSEEGLRTALRFGVTTEVDLVSIPDEMMRLRDLARTSLDVADVRSCSFGLTHPDGHPHQLRRGRGDPEWPTARDASEVPAFVDARIAEGADYLKVLLEDGGTLGEPVPRLDPEVLRAVVRVGHDRGRLVLAHALSLAATHEVIDAGADALTHLFVDAPHTTEVIDRIAASGAFVIPTLSVAASITGRGAGAELMEDPRVSDRIPPEWAEAMRRNWATIPPQNWEHVPGTLAAVKAAGIDVVAGTDAHVGSPGIAHGASMHFELRMMTEMGWTPAEALRSATALPARRLGLVDRGRVAVGRRADLLLVDGDPTRSITDTLSTRTVWRHGARLDAAVVAG